ncbi:unnamed protein product [Peniophora sp. CBMAI 1063]|nr:unnamed protein product [Peniophora sp. CBMAI 1063]
MPSTTLSGPPSVVSVDDLSESDAISSSSVASDAEQPSRVSTSGASDEVKHSRFYYEDGSLSVMVKGTLFRVHGSVFASLSPFWAQKLQSRSDSSDAIHEINDKTANDLASFLSVVYPRNFTRHEVETAAEWSAVLRFATMWQFDAVQQLSIQQLDRCVQPVDRLVLAREFYITDWLPRAFASLIMREQPLTWDEMRVLDLKDVAQITTARESVARQSLPVDEQIVLRYVHEHILKGADATPASLSSPHTDTSSITTSEHHSLVEGAASPPEMTASHPINTTRSASSPRASGTLVSTEFPNLVSSLIPHGYVPYTADDRLTLITNLKNARFDKAFESIELASVAAFCEALRSENFTEHRYGQLVHRLIARAARKPDFQPVGVEIATFVTKVCGHGSFLTEYVQKSKDAWGSVDSEQLSDDNIEATLNRFAGPTPSTPLYHFVVGEKGFLAFYPEICRERVKHLKAFLEALSAAGLV